MINSLKSISKFTLAFVMLVVIVYGQDPHFTQFHRIPTYYNPASTGQDVEHIRLTGLYRNQWASVTSPFVTQSIFFDKQVSKVGLGATLINNTSGDAGIRQLYVNGTLSYRVSYRNHQLASGIQVGLIQKSFDPSKMTFDDQYNPDQGYNPSNPTSETFSYTKLTRPDFGVGFLWTYGKEKNNRLHPYAGAAFQHINQSKETFIETPNIIPRKLVMQGGVGIHVNEQLDLIPMFMYQQQQFSKELMYGFIAKLPMQERTHVEAGVFHRKDDAVSAYVGYQMNSFMVGVSYDVNVSGLTGGPGAFELTLTYIPKAKVKSKPTPKKEKEEKDTKPSSKTNEVIVPLDSDGDGVEDKKDACPDVAGVFKMKGCPAKVKKVIPGKPTGTHHKKAPTKKSVIPVLIPVAKIVEKPKVEIPIKTIEPVVTTPIPVIAPTIPEITEIILDSDNDGVPNNVDECPYIKGKLSMHGCPDSDDDGIADAKDPCPFVGGKKGGNGCPEVEENVPVEVPGGNIEFATNSIDVRGIYKLDIIEPALDSVYYNSNYKLVITGHTDGEGDATFNMNLSQARADVVKAIFIKKGLTEDRIITVAYGETMPIANNIEEQGRAHNRRVEIHVVKTKKQ